MGPVSEALQLCAGGQHEEAHPVTQVRHFFMDKLLVSDAHLIGNHYALQLEVRRSRRVNVVADVI